MFQGQFDLEDQNRSRPLCDQYNDDRTENQNNRSPQSGEGKRITGVT